MEDVEFDRAADGATVVTRYGLPGPAHCGRSRRFFVLTVAATIVVGSAASTRIRSLVGSAILVAGSAALVAARIRYRRHGYRLEIRHPSNTKTSVVTLSITGELFSHSGANLAVHSRYARSAIRSEKALERRMKNRRDDAR